MVSRPASLTFVSSSFVSSTSSGIIILCVLSSLLKRKTNKIKTTFSIKLCKLEGQTFYGVSFLNSIWKENDKQQAPHVRGRVNNNLIMILNTSIAHFNIGIWSNEHTQKMRLI